MLLTDVLKGRKTSSIPVVVTGAGLARELFGVPWEEFRVHASLLAEAQLKFRQQTGMDWVTIYSDALAIPEVLGCTVRFSRISGPLIDRQLSLQNFKPLPEIDYYATPSSGAMLDAVGISVRAVQDIPVGVLFEAPFTTALRIFDAPVALKVMFKEPELLRTTLDFLTDVLIGFAAEAIRRGASVFHIPDPFSSLDFISPRHYREFSKPYQTRLFEAIHRRGGHVILHMCGNTAEIWPDMAETGALALSLDQKMVLGDARAVLGEKIALAGNVDPIKVLLMGDRDGVRRAATNCIETAGPDRFVLMPGCGTPQGTPIENVREMVIVAKEYNVGLRR